ncbi:hypothetical protein JOS77_01430 [Chromobacterium haemolyticum]|nr:hypothetical protein JOS77_01430 [Chromobacterium haemolyticum]
MGFVLRHPAQGPGLQQQCGARISELYQTDDRSFKQDFKQVGASLPQMLGFVFKNTGTHSAGWARRAASILNVLRHGKAMADELINTRCHRGADIARQLRFNENVARGIQSLDEHWDGSGRPLGLRGDAIPLNSRIALLAQVIDVFHITHGRQAALDQALRRAGGWFDPELVAAFRRVSARPDFWRQTGGRRHRSGGAEAGAGPMRGAAGRGLSG